MATASSASGVSTGLRMVSPPHWSLNRIPLPLSGMFYHKLLPHMYIRTMPAEVAVPPSHVSPIGKNFVLDQLLIGRDYGVMPGAAAGHSVVGGGGAGAGRVAAAQRSGPAAVGERGGDRVHAGPARLLPAQPCGGDAIGGAGDVWAGGGGGAVVGRTGGGCGLSSPRREVAAAWQPSGQGRRTRRFVDICRPAAADGRRADAVPLALHADENRLCNQA